MMIDKRLIRTVRESKKYIAWNVIYQWISLVANITMMVSIADLLSRLFANTADRENFVCTVIVVAAAVGIRYFCAVQSAKGISFFQGGKESIERKDIQETSSPGKLI